MGKKNKKKTKKKTSNRDKTASQETILKKSDQNQLEQIKVEDSEVISEFLHKRKTQIMNLLLDDEKTIRELSEDMDLNPGSVKRYLDSLRKNGLVFQTKISQNRWGIRLKYYQTTAKKYIIKFIFPNDSPK